MCQQKETAFCPDDTTDPELVQGKKLHVTNSICEKSLALCLLTCFKRFRVEAGYRSLVSRRRSFINPGEIWVIKLDDDTLKMKAVRHGCCTGDCGSTRELYDVPFYLTLTFVISFMLHSLLKGQLVSFFICDIWVDCDVRWKTVSISPSSLNKPADDLFKLLGLWIYFLIFFRDV